MSAMSDLLHELENNEAILLMYIAGELPDEERREVEQMLDTDVRLREMYEGLRSSWDDVVVGLERVDASEPLGSSRDAAARAVGRMVRQRYAARVAARPVAKPAAPRPTLKLWLAWSSSVAAALLVGFLVWWGIFADPFSVGLSGSERLVVERGALPGQTGGYSSSQAADLIAVSPVDPLGLWNHSLYEAQSSMEHLTDLSRGLTSAAEN